VYLCVLSYYCLGNHPATQATDAIQEMKDKVDTLIVVANDQLLQVVPENTPLTDAFLVADDILRQGVVGISDIIVKPGLVNVDFADVRTIMGNAGTFHFFMLCVLLSVAPRATILPFRSIFAGMRGS
jgi:cell division GTPase FtsZ